MAVLTAQMLSLLSLKEVYSDYDQHAIWLKPVPPLDLQRGSENITLKLTSTNPKFAVRIDKK